MLGIVSANGARLNAASVGVSLAGRWSEAGRRVLFIDVDPARPPLAERYGAAVRVDYAPETRGLPSLIAAREPLTLKSVAQHCYSLDDAEGLRWALFAPSHPGGTRYAAQWLAERAGELAEINRQRSIVVSTSLQSGEVAQIPLLKALPILVIVAPVRDRDEAAALRLLCDGLGLLDDRPGDPPQQRILIIEGESTDVGDNEVMGLTRLYVEGRLPFIEDEKLLRGQGSRKDRAFMREFDRISDELMQRSGQKVEPADQPAPPAPDPHTPLAPIKAVG